MENPSGDEEKFTNIRQTIRKVVLPLVQAIYDKDPSDIILFCSSYFDDLLRKRENTKERKVEEFGYKREEDIPSSIQGSASAPLLSTDKHTENLSIRETSSWDVATNLPQMVGSRTCLNFNIVDSVFRIGDQPSPAAKQTGLEKDAEAGDTQTSLKEEKEFSDNSHSENESASEAKIDLTEDEAPTPSAPPVEDTEQISGEANAVFEEKETSERESNLNPGCASTEHAAEANDIEKCSKQLSPNSSFGFIPHLAYDSTDEMKKIYDEYSDKLGFQRKTNEEIEELAKRFTETFQNLAQEFNSAETNFNAEFQNAKEISDVIQGRQGSRAPNSDDVFDQVSNRDDDTLKDEKSETNDFNSNEPDLDYAKDVNNNLTIDKSEDACKLKETIDITDSEYISQGEKHDTEQETIEDSTKPDAPLQVENKCSREEKCLDKEEYESTLFRDSKKDDSNKSHFSDSHPTVDESWRKRWYESHPRLDNFGNSFQREHPRVTRAHRAFVNHRHNIGEAGDVPSPRFYIQGGGATDMNHPLDASHESVAGSTSTTNECSNSRSGFTSDEIRSKANGGKPARGLTARDIPGTNMPSIPSKNIPYSWRKMCKNQTGFPEGEAHSYKESRITFNTETADAEKSKKEANMLATNERKTIPESVELKGTDKEKTTDPIDNNQNKIALEMYKREVRENFSKTGQYEEHLENIISKSVIDQSCNTDEIQPDEEIGHGIKFKEFFPSQNDSLHYHDVSRSESSSNWRKPDIIEGSVEMATEPLGHAESSMDAGNSQDSDISMLVEPGLNAACGDFAPPQIPEIRGQDFNLQAAGRQSEKNNAAYANKNPQTAGISAEYFEEIIDSVIEQQREAAKEAYECLNFSGYSESDSSNVESSDFSEPDDFNLNNTKYEN